MSLVFDVLCPAARETMPGHAGGRQGLLPDQQELRHRPPGAWTSLLRGPDDGGERIAYRVIYTLTLSLVELNRHIPAKIVTWGTRMLLLCIPGRCWLYLYRVECMEFGIRTFPHKHTCLFQMEKCEIVDKMPQSAESNLTSLSCRSVWAHFPKSCLLSWRLRGWVYLTRQFPLQSWHLSSAADPCGQEPLRLAVELIAFDISQLSPVLTVWFVSVFFPLLGSDWDHTEVSQNEAAELCQRVSGHLHLVFLCPLPLRH